MSVGYLKFEDDGAGGVTVSGGIDGTLDPASPAHITVLRMSQNVEPLGAFISALPPVHLTDVPVAEAEPAVVLEA